MAATSWAEKMRYAVGEAMRKLDTEPMSGRAFIIGMRSSGDSLSMQASEGISSTANV